ncbi:MAG: 50S ribosomal protein L24e [Candidatus Nanoarchaeia archaeon]|nr:50S ribosomal protein L24e [Candidatus Nanoarchaeia archaeon]
MVVCTFCGKEITYGRGIKFVKKDGRVFDFCATKCEKNLLKHHRKPAKFKWTVDGRKKDSKRINKND